MEFEGWVEFANVEVLDEDDCVLLCRVRGRQHWLGVGRLRAGTTIAHRGDRGILVLERQFALERNLIASVARVRSLTQPPSAP
jgi:hypothetical protein